MSDRVFAIIVKIFRLISKTPATERIIPIRNKIFMIHRQCHFTIDSEGKFNNSEIINLDISSKMYIYIHETQINYHRTRARNIC